MKPALYEQVEFSNAVLYGAFRMQFYIVRLANSLCVVSRIRRQVNHW